MEKLCYIWSDFYVSFHLITLHWSLLCFLWFEHIFTFPFISKHSIDLDFVLYHLNDLVRIKIVQFDRLTIHMYERTFISYCGSSSSYPIIQVCESRETIYQLSLTQQQRRYFVIVDKNPSFHSIFISTSNTKVTQNSNTFNFFHSIFISLTLEDVKTLLWPNQISNVLHFCFIF